MCVCVCAESEDGSKQFIIFPEVGGGNFPGERTLGTEGGMGGGM